jgi:hypothetical protein
MSRLSSLGLSLVLVVCVGCGKPDSKPAGDSVFGKKTQDIGKFDANKADQVVSNQKIHASDPITGPLSAYPSMMEKVAIVGVDYHLGVFNATEGRYPASHEEFMEKIIKANDLKLPVLPYKGQYVYDVEKHELKAVYTREQAEKKDQ